MRTVAENLKIALDLLQTHGLGQSALYDPYTGCYCSVGAIYAARTGKRGMAVISYDEIRHEQRAFTDTPESDAVRQAMAEAGLLIEPFDNSSHIDVYLTNDSVAEPTSIYTAFTRAIEHAQTAA